MNTITPQGRIVKTNGDRWGRYPDEEVTPLDTGDTFNARWLEETDDNFIADEIFDAYEDERDGRTYGLSLRGEWLPIGEEGRSWEWVNYGGKRGLKLNPAGFRHARPFGGSVGREQWHVHFEDAKGVIFYYAGNTDRGVKLERGYEKAKKMTGQGAAKLAKRLNTLYKNVRHDGGHFFAHSASDMSPRGVKENGSIKARLAAEYERLIGYNPFLDDPQISVAEVQRILKEYKEERRALARQQGVKANGCHGSKKKNPPDLSIPSDEAALRAPNTKRVRAKLFANRSLPEGTLVAVRKNLRSKMLMPDGGMNQLQTVHEKRTGGKALGFDIAVTVRNATFAVNQKARRNIASGTKPKSPMAGAVGGIVQHANSLEGLPIGFNPKRHHLFVDPEGYAVRAADEVTVFGDRAYARGNIRYWSEADAPKPLDNIPSAVRYKS